MSAPRPFRVKTWRNADSTSLTRDGAFATYEAAERRAQWRCNRGERAEVVRVDGEES